MFDAVTKRPACTMGLDGYGISEGNRADMVILQGRNPIEATRLRGPRLAIIRHGKVIAEADPAVSRLCLDDRELLVDFSLS